MVDWEVTRLRSRGWEGSIPTNKVKKGDFVDILHYILLVFALGLPVLKYLTP